MLSKALPPTLLAALALAAPAVAAPTPGSLDATFSGDGRVTTNLGAEDGAAIVARQADGKLVVGGFSDDDFALARYTTAGALDPTFSGDGKLTLPFGDDDGATITDVAVQPNGRIVVVGNACCGNWILARVLPGGALDPSFGGGDGIVTGGGTTQGTGSVAVDTDGSILLTTDDQITLGHFAGSLIRVNAAGTSTRYLAGTEDDGYYSDIALQADGKNAVGGDPLRRYLPSRAGDPSFPAARPDGGGAPGRADRRRLT